MAQTNDILDELDSLGFAERLKLVEMEVLRLRKQLGQHQSDGVWYGKSVQQLAEEQGVRAVQHPMDLRVDFWPPDESVDDFVATIRQWRDESKAP